MCSKECFEKLLNNCSTLSAFTGRINKISDIIEATPEDQPNPLYTNPSLKLSGRATAMKFKGDVFELFTEFFIKMSPIDDRIDVYDYQLVTENDTGVDGWGYNREGKIITVQVKYRMWDYELTSIKEHLDNFRWTSYKKYGIKSEDVGRMLVITTGKEIHWKTLERYFSGKVKCISNNASYGCLRGACNQTIDGLFSLKTITDNNLMFWKCLEENVVK